MASQTETTPKHSITPMIHPVSSCLPSPLPPSPPLPPLSLLPRFVTMQTMKYINAILVLRSAPPIHGWGVGGMYKLYLLPVMATLAVR